MSDRSRYWHCKGWGCYEASQICSRSVKTVDRTSAVWAVLDAGNLLNRNNMLLPESESNPSWLESVWVGWRPVWSLNTVLLLYSKSYLFYWIEPELDLQWQPNIKVSCKIVLAICLRNSILPLPCLPVDRDSQEVEDGGGAAEDVAHGPHLAQFAAERPLLADLKERKEWKANSTDVTPPPQTRLCPPWTWARKKLLPVCCTILLHTSRIQVSFALLHAVCFIRDTFIRDIVRI